MTQLLADEIVIRWRRLAQVDISTMQADTAIVELSRAVLLLLDEDLELRAKNTTLATGARDAMELVVNLRMERDLLNKALKYAGDTNTNLTKLLKSSVPELYENNSEPSTDGRPWNELRDDEDEIPQGARYENDD